MEVASPTDKLVACPSCGETNPARFRLCGFCGTQLHADRPSDEIRRYVTVVNSDLKGSTALGERLDPESLREVLTRYFDEMQIVFESHGGTIEKIIGDAVVAVGRGLRPAGEARRRRASSGPCCGADDARPHEPERPARGRLGRPTRHPDRGVNRRGDRR